MEKAHTSAFTRQSHDLGSTTSQEKSRAEEKKEQKERSSMYNNNTVTTSPTMAHGATRLLIGPEDAERIREAYVEAIGPMTGPIARCIEDTMYYAEATVDDILWAIEETGFAPRPSALYLRAILTRWQTEGVHFSRCMTKDSPKWWKA